MIEKPKEEDIKSFVSPTEIPKRKEDRTSLQKANYEWWTKNPMRYDWKDKVAPREFSREFFEEIDRRFFSNSEEYLSCKKVPFDGLIDFSSLKNKDVLEIGVGNGGHAGLLAGRAKTFAGIDLTDYAVKSTTERFKVFGLPGSIIRMDAERLEFPDNNFDFVWSWGVIHHSSNTRKILEEIRRVLRPGGEAVIMVYYRGWWNYYVVEFLRGIVSGTLFRTKSLHRTVQLHTDGAIARYYSVGDWEKTTRDLFELKEIFTLGPKSDVIPLPAGRLKNILRSILPSFLNQFLTRNLRMGCFLVSRLRKI